jgi:hypothetical protein
MLGPILATDCYTMGFTKHDWFMPAAMGGISGVVFIITVLVVLSA